MKMMTSAAHMSSELPPGFRFHPTDEELIMCYLRNQATSKPCPVSIIAEVDIYKFDPWQLPDKAEFGDKEWYFFSPRDRKYPNGARPNRATISGYWKATGTDKVIHSGSTHVGVKKALVFYKGRPPKGVKTDWIMHEYRLTGSEPQTKLNRTMRLDDWVLCRIYKKKPMVGHWFSPRKVEEQNYANDQTILRTFSESNFLDMDDIGSISQILSDDQFYNPAPETQNSTGYNQQQYRGNEKFQQGEVTYPCIDQGSYQAATQYISKQMLINLNPVYEFQWPAGVLQGKKFDLDIAIDNL